MLTLTRYAMQQVLTDLNTHVASGNYDGVLRGAKMLLYTAVTGGETVDSVLADVTECDFTGYAQQAVTWAGPYASMGSGYELVGSLTNWSPSDGVTPNVALGWGLVDSGGTHLLALERFDNPVSLIDAFSYLGVVPKFTYTGADAGTGEVVQ